MAAAETQVEIPLSGMPDLGEMAVLAAEAGIDIRTLIGMLLSGEWDPRTLLVNLLEGIPGAVLQDVRKYAFLSLPPVVCTVMLGLLLGKGASHGSAVRLVCRLSLIGTLSNAFANVFAVSEKFMADMLRCVDVMTPVLAAVLHLSGSEIYSATLTPSSAIAADILQNIFANAGTALCTASVAVAAGGNLSKSLSLKRLHALFRQMVQWGIGILMTAFMGMITIQGKLAAGRDSTVVRSAKYAVESIIPMIGGNVSDSLGTVFATASSIRNAVGASGLVIICVLSLKPLARIGTIVMIMKIFSAVSEPLGDSGISDMFMQFAGAMELLLVLCIASALLCTLLVGSCMTSVGAFLF